MKQKLELCYGCKQPLDDFRYQCVEWESKKWHLTCAFENAKFRLSENKPAPMPVVPIPKKILRP